jgi:ribosomal protein L37AE/L43A
MKPRCKTCKKIFSVRRVRAGYKVCLDCGEKQATRERKGWTILAPHKQGPMFFTAESAREMAVGINNKGGLVK